MSNPSCRIPRAAPFRARTPRAAPHAAVVAAHAAIVLAIGCAASACAEPAPALVPGGWMSGWSDGAPATGIAPSIWTTGRRVGFTVGGTVALDLGHASLLRPDATLAPSNAVLELGATGGGSTPQAGPASGAVSARLHLAGRTSGMWLGSSGFQTTDDGRTMAVLGLGWWLERGRFTIASQAMQLLGALRTTRYVAGNASDPDSNRTAAVGRQGVMQTDVRLLTGAETSLGWSLDRLALQSRVGVALGERHRPARWAELSAAYAVHPKLALFTRLRTAADMPSTLEPVRGAQTALGIQLTPGREIGAAPTAAGARERARGIERLELNGRRLVVHAAARSLELRGDLTDWQPVAARPIGHHRWLLDLDLSPGVHRVSIRLDGGAWTPPPGVPAEPDDYGGEVGIIVVD